MEFAKEEAKHTKQEVKHEMSDKNIKQIIWNVTKSKRHKGNNSETTYHIETHIRTA